MVDIKLNYPGSYLVVDHALSRVGKGLRLCENSVKRERLRRAEAGAPRFAPSNHSEPCEAIFGVDGLC
jgi:hypothetical protein